jgi:hypothetical protein
MKALVPLLDTLGLTGMKMHLSDNSLRVLDFLNILNLPNFFKS